MQMDRGLFNSVEEDVTEANQRCLAEQNSQHAEQSKKATPRKSSVNKPTGRGLRQRLEKNQFRCELSGVLLTPETLSLDHEVPLAHGGVHAEENLLLVHAVVNIMKGRLSRDEFVSWCRAVADYADTHTLPPVKGTSEG